MRNGASVWHSVRQTNVNAEITTYNEPKRYTLAFRYLTIQPASGYMSLMEFGEKISKTWTGIANSNIFSGVFKEGDRMYVDGAEPNAEFETEKGYGSTANAVIKSVLEQNQGIRLVIEKVI